MSDLFWQIWDRLFCELPGHQQAEVLTFRGGPVARSLWERAHDEAYPQ